MRTIKLSILLIILCVFCSCQQSKSNKENKESLPALTYIQQKIQSWVTDGYYDGASVRVVKDDKVFFESCFGDYTDTTTLHVASAGKWVAAATVAAIVDEGKLSWDEPVKKYLPEFTDIKGDATLRQLLSHTAGYPDYQPQGQRRDDYQTLEESVKHIVNLPADTIPGTKFRYGGLSMQVAGRMAEIATGKDWETLFQEKIAKPLRMQNSSFTPVSEEAGFNPMLGGGFKTNLHDYMNFLEMILHDGKYAGNEILTKQSVEEIEGNQISDALVKQPEYVVDTRRNYHSGIYGLGCWREEIDEKGKSTLISSAGWAGAYPWVDRKNNCYGFILAKVNEQKVNEQGFSSFYSSPVLPLLIRDAIKQQNYPKELKRGEIKTGQAKLYYEELGKGKPLILIHGHSLNRDMWDKQFFYFANKYRVIRYDLRGYGYSSPQVEGVQFTHVEDLISLMDSLNIDKAHIIGLSLGGYIATDVLGWYPDRVLSAILASGNIRHNPKPSIPMDDAEAERRDKEIAIVKKSGIDNMKREWFYALMSSGGTNREIMRHPLWNMIYQWDAWQPLHKEARVTAGDDAYEMLKLNKPKIPVLIVEGKSENNSYDPNPEILSYLPHGNMIIINNAGHMLNMEQPDKFNDIVFQFLTESNRNDDENKN